MTPTEELIEAAKAVIARWDSTDWKAPPTADVMNRLRNALAELSRREAEAAKPARCVCWKDGARTCGRHYKQFGGALPLEFCENEMHDGLMCGHSRACHGGEV